MASPRPLPPKRRVIENVGLLEGLKDGFLLVGRDADPSIADRKMQIHFALGGSFPPDIDLNFPLFRELDRVADEVDHDLAQAVAVSAEQQRHLGADAADQFQALSLRPDRQRL